MNEKTQGMYDKTGGFLSFYHHGFVLVIAKWQAVSPFFFHCATLALTAINSSKYPLATVKALIDAFGINTRGGYDISCKFGITLSCSPLRFQAKGLNYRALVGCFHRHAHNCLCQLCFLATYVKGMGLEDLEGSECSFSKSNALTSGIHHMGFQLQAKDCWVHNTYGPKQNIPEPESVN